MTLARILAMSQVCTRSFCNSVARSTIEGLVLYSCSFAASGPTRTTALPAKTPASPAALTALFTLGRHNAQGLQGHAKGSLGSRTAIGRELR